MKTALRAGDPVIMLEPKALFASKGEVPVGRAFCPLRGCEDGAGRFGHHHRRGRPNGGADARGGGGAGGRGNRGGGDRPSDHHAARRRHHRRRASRRPIACWWSTRAWAMCGIGGEIAQAINELAFDHLDAPVGGCTRRRPRIRLRRYWSGRCWSTSRASSRGRGRCSPASRRCRIIGGRRTSPGPPAVAAGAAAGGRGGARRRSLPVRPRRGGDQHAVRRPDGQRGQGRRLAEGVGDRVEAGELVAEIETDKAVVEIEAPSGGTLAAIDQPVGSVVPMGGRIGVVRA